MVKSVYYLTTRSKTMLIDGQMETVYLLNDAAFVRATEVRVAKRWADKPSPKYVAMGALEDSYEVYRWDDPATCVAHSYVEIKQFVGFLSGRGKALEIERWPCISLHIAEMDYFSMAFIRERIFDALHDSGVVTRSYVRVRKVLKDFPTKTHGTRTTHVARVFVDVHSPNPNDLVMAKVVMSGYYLVSHENPA